MFHHRELKQRAEQALNGAACDAKQLLLIHLGVVSVISLVLTVVSYFLQDAMDSTVSGLGGIGERSMIATAIAMLQLLFFVLTPFWQISYRTVSLSIARGQTADSHNLFAGFRAFGPVLRLYLLLALIFGVVFMGCNYLSSFLYMMTPWGQALSDQLTGAIAQPSDALSGQTVLNAFADYAIPLLVLNLLLFLIFAIPFFYRIRLSLFRVMDGQSRALQAILESAAMTKGHRIRLLKLDLSYWWYYAAQILISLIAYADIALEYLGYPLPWHPAVLLFVPYICYLVLHFGFQFWQKNRVAVTYALAYEALRREREAPKHPWANPNERPSDQ